jgi:hypothetical protein
MVSWKVLDTKGAKKEAKEGVKEHKTYHEN